MRRIVLTYGLIAGAILGAMMFITAPFHDEIGVDRGMVIGYTTMVLAFLMIYFGIRTYGESVVRGPVGFGRACKVGTLITLVATCCYVAAWEAVSRTFFPDFADKYAAQVLEKERAAGASPESLANTERKMDEFRVMYRNPLARIPLTFLEPLPVGLLMTLVSAGLLARKRGGAPSSS